MKRLANIALVLLVLLISVPLAANGLRQSTPLAARVLKIDGRSTAYTVERNKKQVRVTFNMPLLNGDRITVLTPKISMKIHYVDGHDETVTQQKSPYTVTSRATVPTRVWNFIVALWDDVTKAHDSGLDSHSIRGDEELALNMPGLRDGSATIAAGERNFMLEWTGGKAPYRVVLRAEPDRLILDEPELPTRQLVKSSRAVVLAPGGYSIEVTDAAGAKVRGTFIASADDVWDNWEGAPGASEAEHALDAGAALVSKRDRKRMFEAYLRLYPAIRQKYEPAQALTDYLAVGAPAAQ